MNETEIRSFIESYFRAFESTFVEENPAYFTVQLPVEVDKDLGNRPFYWTYVEKIGIEPNPLHLTFIFDPDHIPEGLRGEQLRFGSRRLHQIFESAKKHGKYLRLYEEADRAEKRGALSSIPLVPWLGINYKIEFVCDQKREVILPLGVNLLSGGIVSDFYQKICSLQLTPRLPDYSFTMQPIFGIDSATERLEQHIQHLLDQEETTWAQNALERLKEEKELVESYFGDEILRQESTDDDEVERMQKRKKLLQEKETRIQELTWQFEPRIIVSIINCGIFFLRTQLV